METKISTQNSSVLNCFTTIDALEVTHLYRHCTVRALDRGMPLCTSSRLCVRWWRLGRLKLATMGGVIPQKSANSTGSRPDLLFCWLSKPGVGKLYSVKGQIVNTLGSVSIQSLPNLLISVTVGQKTAMDNMWNHWAGLCSNKLYLQKEVGGFDLAHIP